jgi:hypothetical protein
MCNDILSMTRVSDTYFVALEISCAPSIPLLFPAELLTTTNLFTFFMVLPFPQGHIVEII